MVNIDNLFRLIAQNGITQSKLAEDTSISTGNISDWKKGKSMPSAIKLDELATYFGCSVDYLLGRTDEPNSEINQNITAGANNSRSNNVSSGAKAEESFTEPTDNVTQKFLDVFIHLDLGKQIDVMKYALEQAEKSA